MTAATRQLVESASFDRAIGTVIVLNAVFLGAQTYSDAAWLNWANGACLMVFVGELVLRLTANGRDFFKHGWNIFDAVVIVASLTPGIGAVAQIVRLARVARLVRFLPDAQVLISGAMKALPALGSLLALTGLLIFLYAMVAVELFGQAIPDRYGDIGSAALSLFLLLSLESFPDYMYAGMEVTLWAVPFFISYALLAAFVVFNLIIGIVISSLEDARADRKPAGELTDEIAAMRAALDNLESSLGAGMQEQ